MSPAHEHHEHHEHHDHSAHAHHHSDPTLYRTPHDAMSAPCGT